jgi:hypothetical protein
MTFEFMYGDTWYKYEAGYIYRQNSFGNHIKLIPVVQELSRSLEDYSLDQKQTIMCAILHGFTCGKLAGAANKVAEIKRVLNID